MPKKKINSCYDNNNLVEQLTDGVLNALPRGQGLFQTDHQDSPVSFRPAQSTTIINHANAYIVFGKDRPGGLATGYGAKGACDSDTIDIVVGRLSSVKRNSAQSSNVITGNNFGADAARIYISQMTNVDTNFGLVSGRNDPSHGKSAIAIKADAVRIIGREGVKITTGKAPFTGFGSNGELNSLGGKIIKPKPPIEFIAGNVITDSEHRVWDDEQNKYVIEVVNGLQPVGKADNMAKALQDINVMLDQLIGAVLNLSLISTAFNSVVSVNPLPHYPGAGSAAVSQIINTVTTNLYNLRINSAFWAYNHCDPRGYRYIGSKSTFTT
tara:strand:+ start:1713 stop:2687 length:975 start_codon:yes stop_codon:yes gene_type:complete